MRIDELEVGFPEQRALFDLLWALGGAPPPVIDSDDLLADPDAVIRAFCDAVALPYLPDVIGVVTSPTGAVIRDILHRLNDRFPRHVLLAPVLVQGDGAAAQVAAARLVAALPVEAAPVAEAERQVEAAGPLVEQRGAAAEPTVAAQQRALAPRDLELVDGNGNVLEVRSPGAEEPTDIRVEQSDFLYYVLRIPLNGDEAGLQAAAGDEVRLIVETPEFELPEFVQQRLANRRPGSGGGGFGSSNRRRRGPNLSDLDPPDPIRLPVSVVLAAGG